jgi:hypothetical protein
MWESLQNSLGVARTVDFSVSTSTTALSLFQASSRRPQSLSFSSCISRSWSMSLMPVVCLGFGLNLVQLLTSDLLSTLVSTPSLPFAVDVV